MMAWPIGSIRWSRSDWDAKFRAIAVGIDVKGLKMAVAVSCCENRLGVRVRSNESVDVIRVVLA